MNELTLIKQQAESIFKTVEEMEKIAERVIDVEKNVLQMKDEFQADIDEIRSTYPLNRGEAILLNNSIKNKAHELTMQYFGRRVSKELFSKKRIHLSIGLGHQLKKTFNSITYNTIRHLDYDAAKTFVNQFELTNLPPKYLELTEHQYDLVVKHGDDISEDFRGAHQRILELV